MVILSLPLKNSQIQELKIKSNLYQKLWKRYDICGQAVILSGMAGAVLLDPETSWTGALVILGIGFFVHVVYRLQIPLIVSNKAGFVYQFNGVEVQSTIDGSELAESEFDHIDVSKEHGAELLKSLKAIGRKPLLLEVELSNSL